MEIIVRSHPNSGKSTIALLIHDALKKAGITDVGIKDEELHHTFYAAEAQKKRIAALEGKQLKITIRTEQLARTATVNHDRTVG